MRVLHIPKRWPAKPIFASSGIKIRLKYKKFNARLTFLFVYALRSRMDIAKIIDRVLIRFAHNTYPTLSWLGHLPPRLVSLTRGTHAPRQAPYLDNSRPFSTCVH